MLSKKMNAETKRRRNNLLFMLAVFALLIVIGLENILSSTFVLDDGGSIFGYLGKQLGFLVMGIAAGALVWHAGYQFLRRWCGLFAVISALLLLAVKAVGITVNGAQRWLGYGAVSFQPSEFAKLAAIVCMASSLAFYLERHGNRELMNLHLRNLLRLTRAEAVFPPLKRFFERLFRYYAFLIFLPPAILALLVFTQPDAGTGIVIFMPAVLMFFCSGMPLFHFKLTRRRVIIIGIAVVVLGGLFCSLLTHSYQWTRIVTWIDPWSYSQSSGYQSVQSLIAIGSGGVFGQGLGTGISKFNYLPEAHTDFAFAIIAQEWGFIGAIIVPVLFCCLLSLGVRTAGQCRDYFGMFLSLGITFSLCGQGMVNMSMVTNLFPVVGVPLPFISYGGSSLILNIISATLLLRIAYDNFCDAERRQAGPLGQKPVWSIREGVSR